jgi:hypothetical protein
MMLSQFQLCSIISKNQLCSVACAAAIHVLLLMAQKCSHLLLYFFNGLQKFKTS